MNPLKTLIIVTNIGLYVDGKLKTGLWLCELTRLYYAAREKGYEITIASPNGEQSLFTLNKVSAYQLGFGHPQSFHRLFKSHTVVSSLEFRASFN